MDANLGPGQQNSDRKREAPVDSLPAVRETDESAAREDPVPSAQEDPVPSAKEDPVPSASTAATQLLTVTGDPLPFIDISSSANTDTVKSVIYFNFSSESCTTMMKNRPALDACFDAASTSSIEFVKVLLARDVEKSLPQLSGDIPVIKVQDPHNLTGLRSTIPSPCIRQPFKECLLSLGNSNQMMSHPHSVRHYTDDGKEKIRTRRSSNLSTPWVDQINLTSSTVFHLVCFPKLLNFVCSIEAPNFTEAPEN